MLVGVSEWVDTLGCVSLLSVWVMWVSCMRGYYEWVCEWVVSWPSEFVV